MPSDFKTITFCFTDDDFEYTMCEEMVGSDSWAHWLTEDEDGDVAPMMKE